MYLNTATIVGNITRDPELKAIPTGLKTATFSVATNRVWKDKNGAKQEAADYHNIVVFGNQAENVAQYMKKGSQILIQGRIQTRSWDDKTTGEKKYRTEIIAERVQFGNNKNNTANEAENSSKLAEKSPLDKFEGPDSFNPVDYPEENINIEDIPF